MGPYVDSINPDEALPAATSVAIIGGGIIGTSAAFTLASRGVAVMLFEKGYIACEQSSRNWGWCRQAGRDAREMPLIVESLRLWRDMNRLTEADTGFRECGVLYVGENEADEQHFCDWITMAAPYEIGARIVRGDELKALMPGASRTFRCGLHVPTDGCAEPQRAAPAIARAAQRKGALIATHCAVRGIERAGGRVAAVVTERGRVACDSVILAGGAWSSLFCASLWASPAAAESPGFGDANGPVREWPGCLHVGGRSRLSEAPRRWLHPRQRRRPCGAAGAGFAAFSARIPALAAQGVAILEAAREQTIAARAARAAALGAR
jgi:glycine/D-amino acid oxidase-like deaminating enzyme